MIVMSSDGEYQTAIVNGYGFIYVSNDFGQSKNSSNLHYTFRI